jgi:hypothetical protein
MFVDQAKKIDAFLTVDSFRPTRGANPTTAHLGSSVCEPTTCDHCSRLRSRRSPKVKNANRCITGHCLSGNTESVEPFEARDQIRAAATHIQTVSEQAYFYGGLAFGITLVQFGRP